jgi:hypothetical protein
MADEDDFRKRMERFFYLVGYAITHWAYVDRSLFEFCQFCLDTTERKTAIVFHRTPNIGDHLGLANALMHATEMKPQTLKRWEQIVSATEKLLPFRNEIAHNPPTQVGFIKAAVSLKEPETPGRMFDVTQWWEIRTEPTKLLHQPSRKKRREIRADEDQILDHIQKLDRLQTAIYAVDWELRGRRPGIGPTVPAPVFPADLDRS